VSTKRIPKLIVGFGKSYALLSNHRQVDTAVVFVHGFGGSPTSTWRNFQDLVDEYASDYPWWATSDLFFYSYDSVKTPVGVNAEKLASFLNDVLYQPTLREIRPADFLPQSGASMESFNWGTSNYKNLVCAGHSEGAVLIRRLVLDRFYFLKKAATKSAGQGSGRKTAHQRLQKASKADFLLNAHMRFFAPACLGTNFSSLFGFATSFSALISAIAASSLVRNELLPDSPILKQIQTETESACDKFPLLRAFTAKVLFGDRDQIVYTAAYNCDDIAYQVGHDHFSICKPKYVYKRPLQFVSL